MTVDVVVANLFQPLVKVPRVWAEAGSLPSDAEKLQRPRGISKIEKAAGRRESAKPTLFVIFRGF